MQDYERRFQLEDEHFLVPGDPRFKWSMLDGDLQYRWGEEECVVQFHPPRSEYVNRHPYCLHLWKKIGEEYETPPKEYVG